MRCTFLLQNLGQEKQDQFSSFVNIQDSDSNWTWNKNLKSHFFVTHSWINMTKQNNGSILTQNSFFKTLAVVYKHECDCHQSLLKPDWLIITSYFPPKKHNCSDWWGKQSINVKHNNFMDFPVRISPFPRLELMCTTLFLLCWFDYRAGRSKTCNRRNIIAWNTATSSYLWWVWCRPHTS